MYGLMIMETHELTCPFTKQKYMTAKLLRSDLEIAFFVNLASLLVSSAIVPYFDLTQNLQRKPKEGEKYKFDWRLAPIVSR